MRVLFTAGAVLTGAEAEAREPRRDGEHAVTVFAAQMADNDWHEIVSLDNVGFRQTYLAGMAVSREMAGTKRWAIEVEGQAARHFGAQDHWELNAALVGRWRAFPWSESVATSVAFGIGPSFATRVPSEEVARDGSSNRLLLYWMAELEAGPPDRPWSGLVRLHHRSSAYGAVAENGGSNFITVGVRRRF